MKDLWAASFQIKITACNRGLRCCKRTIIAWDLFLVGLILFGVLEPLKPALCLQGILILNSSAVR